MRPRWIILIVVTVFVLPLVLWLLAQPLIPKQSGRADRLVAAQNTLAERIGLRPQDLGPAWRGRVNTGTPAAPNVRCPGVNLNPSVVVTGRASGHFTGPFALSTTIELVRSLNDARVDWSAWAGRPSYPDCVELTFANSANGFVHNTVTIGAIASASPFALGEDAGRLVEIQYRLAHVAAHQFLVSGFASIGRAELSVSADGPARLRPLMLATVRRAQRTQIGRARTVRTVR